MSRARRQPPLAASRAGSRFRWPIDNATSCSFLSISSCGQCRLSHYRGQCDLHAHLLVGCEQQQRPRILMFRTVTGASSQAASRPAAASPSTHNATDLTSVSPGCVGMRGASLRDRIFATVEGPRRANLRRGACAGRLLCDARLTVSDSGDLGDDAHPGTLRQVVASLVVIEDNGAPRSAIVSD